MINSPDAVYVIIPCMKELRMSWSEIKRTPRNELLGILGAYSNYNIIHQFDGYAPDEVGKLAKDKPEIRAQYNQSEGLKRDYQARAGKAEKITSFNQLL